MAGNCQDSGAGGMKLAGYDPFLEQEKIEALGADYYENYEDLLKISDVVTIHVPLTEETRGMISKRQLSMMKPTALLINCSRGGIVNESDLVEALKEGVIAGAGTDVFCSEPPRADDPLLTCPNLVLSPHSAAQTREAVIKMAQMCVKGCLAVCRGEKWPYVADKAAYDHPRWAGKDWPRYESHRNSYKEFEPKTADHDGGKICCTFWLFIIAGVALFLVGIGPRAIWWQVFCWLSTCCWSGR